jgi:hypothetical protein
MKHHSETEVIEVRKLWEPLRVRLDRKFETLAGTYSSTRRARQPARLRHCHGALLIGSSLVGAFATGGSQVPLLGVSAFAGFALALVSSRRL